MEKEAFKLLHDMEDSWWYKGRKAAAHSAMRKLFEGRRGLRVLDFGAGYGGMRQILERYGRVDAFEIDKEAIASCLARGYNKVFTSTQEVFPKSSSYDLITLFDVVEHFEDDEKLVGALSVMLSPGGHVVITVPAYQWLWSAHDVSHHHYRRYTRGRLCKLLEAGGFEIGYSSYWNMSLLLPAALARALGSSGSSSLKPSSLLDTLFYVVVSLEAKLMKFTSLPFGTGLVVIAHKK